MKLLLAMALILSSSMSFAVSKVGLVNIKLIVSSINEGKAVQDTLKKSFESKKKLIKEQEDKIVKLQQTLQKQSKVLSEEAKAKKFGEIQQKVAATRKQTQQFQKEIQKQESELMKPIMDKLTKVIESISAKEKVDMTFELSASPLVYVAEKVDLSQQVIEAYNKKYKK